MMMKAEGGTPTGYIQFVDPNVEAICATKWGDGVGLTYAQAAAVTSIPNNLFRGNTTITSFDEFQYFTSVTVVTASSNSNATSGCFYNCSNLKSIILPDSITTVGKAAFNGCSNLESINFPDNLTALGAFAFNGCSKLVVTSLNNVTSALDRTFTNADSLVSIVALKLVSTGGASTTNTGTFGSCDSLEYAEFGAAFTTLAQRTFENCDNLKTFICRATSVPSCGANAFRNTNSSLKIYVPNGYGNTYKAASGWSSYSSKIYELDANGNIPS